MMEDSQLIQTELPTGGLITHRPHLNNHRFTPYQLDRTSHKPAIPLDLPAKNQITSSPSPSSSSSSSSTSSPSTITTIQRSKSPRSPSPPPEGTNIGNLYPEILAIIFAKLPILDRGRAAQVCKSWREACFFKSVWRGVEARLHVRKSFAPLYTTLVRRGIRKIQILSMKRTLRDVVTYVTNLETLSLSGCFNVTDHNLSIAISSDFPNLKTLDLSLCKQITDVGISKIAPYITNIEVLELGGCSHISNSGLLILQYNLKKLKRLNLRSCWNISDQGISHLAGVHKELTKGTPGLQLQYLGLQDCQRLSDVALRHIAQGLQTLTSINLSFCVSITDSGLKNLATMPNLRELNLRSCDNISDIGMAYLTEGGSKISSLDVSFCDKISDQALNHLSQGLFRLKSLSLNHCQITDDGLARIAKSMHDLETLNIGQCNRITDYGLYLLSEYLVNLIVIDLYGCNQITPSGLDIIMKLPKIIEVNLGLWLVK